MNSDFRGFMEMAPASPPTGLSAQLQALVEKELNPSPWTTFARLAGIHFFMGLLTLSLCPQFGIRLWGDGMGLMQYFMGLGDIGCGACCGVLFVGGSLFLASLILGPDQVRTIRKHRWLEVGALTFLSLGFFLMLRADIVLGFAMAWMAGSVLGGQLTLELGWALRLRSRNPLTA